VKSRIYVGSALNSGKLSESDYKNVSAQEFDCLTPEWEMKLQAIEKTKGHRDYTEADKLVEFAQQNKMKVRGHTLVWHIHNPDWLQELSKTELQSFLHKHITEEVTRYKGKIYAWDVVNEVFEENGTLRDSVYHKNLGSGYIADAFKIAHEADPNAKIYINDYSTEGKNNKSDGLFKLVSELKSQGVPIHGVGFQSHFLSGQIPTDFAENLKRFTDLGLEVAITELDIRIQLPATNEKLAQQAKEYGHIFKTCVSLPGCVGVTTWGFTDKYSWIPGFFKGYGDALLFDNNYHPKPAVTSIEAALKGV